MIIKIAENFFLSLSEHGIQIAASCSGKNKQQLNNGWNYGLMSVQSQRDEWMEGNNQSNASEQPFKVSFMREKTGSWLFEQRWGRDRSVESRGTLPLVQWSMHWFLWMHLNSKRHYPRIIVKVIIGYDRMNESIFRKCSCMLINLVLFDIICSTFAY